jgi:hypothetical protein
VPAVCRVLEPRPTNAIEYEDKVLREQLHKLLIVSRQTSIDTGSQPDTIPVGWFSYGADAVRSHALPGRRLPP